MTKKIKKKAESFFPHELTFLHIIYIILFSTFFLTYPGNSYYFHFFSRNVNLLSDKQEQSTKQYPVPVVDNPYFIPEVTAQGIYIVDLDSATPVYEKAPHQHFRPASTAKIITALVAMDQFELDQPLKVKRAFNEGQIVGFLPGESISFENALYGLLVHSGNDAGYLIADNYPGGLDAFVTAMNEKAESLSMKESNFTNPAGLDDGNQHTSAFDLSLAARKLLGNPALSRIVSVRDITIPDEDFRHFYRLSNINKLLGEIPGIGGLKTGYTEEAGENLVTFYKKNGHRFVIVILKSEDRFADTRNIVGWIDTNVDYVDL